MHLLQMLEEVLKVSLIVVSLEQIDLPFPHQVLSLANSAEKPSETPLSTWKAELFEQRRLRVLRDPGLV